VTPDEEPEGIFYVRDLIRVDDVEQSLHSLHDMTEAERAELRRHCAAIRAIVEEVRERQEPKQSPA
jgi:hypothetical protein